MVYAFMPAFFFIIFLFHFHMCLLFFFNQAILFINMHEGASAWFTGRKGDDMTTVGPRMAGMGATGPSDFCVYCTRGNGTPHLIFCVYCTRTIFSLPLFLNGFFFLCFFI